MESRQIFARPHWRLSPFDYPSDVESLEGALFRDAMIATGVALAVVGVLKLIILLALVFAVP
jgi:hypothetical protein